MRSSGRRRPWAASGIVKQFSSSGRSASATRTGDTPSAGVPHEASELDVILTSTAPRHHDPHGGALARIMREHEGYPHPAPLPRRGRGDCFDPLAPGGGEGQGEGAGRTRDPQRLAEDQILIPIIFITAHDDALTRERAQKAGAVAYLSKPFDEHSLIGAIETALGRE
ncbi:MAG: response regulator [Candidatus Rokuibacteriota bacterium]